METTRIQAGTPRPLYLTAHGADFSFDGPIENLPHLTRLLRDRFLTLDTLGASFVAWNGNRFDAYIVAAALIREPDLVLRPYMTQSKALRGLRVVRREDINNPRAQGWEFLCGIAVTGLAGFTLAKFVEHFAPDFPKLVDVIDFEREEFNPRNSEHCRYAYRDSEGLYHAITRAQQIMLDTFDEPLAVTMGGACIRIFAAHIPPDVVIEPLIADLREIVSVYAMRGGFCYCNKRYSGSVWKYDLNQAYAAAMRETGLPRGAPNKGAQPPDDDRPFLARITAYKRGNRIPFYCRSVAPSGRVSSVFAFDDIPETWITSAEYRQLESEGWEIDCRECWIWPGAFSMQEYVDKLERLRMTCEGGPSGAIGTMVKATGNHSYGKTVEQLLPIEFMLAWECPDGYVPFYDDGADPIEHVFFRIDEDRKPKAWHQPHLGAWITSHVRMVVRRAALIDPGAWLYADTDCVIFSRDVSDRLDIDPKRYGAWKIEESGAHYQIIAKKVYTEVDATKPVKKLKRSAKGVTVKKLTPDDFTRWFEGSPPVDDQVQIQNFLAVLSGAEMYRSQRREGTRVESVVYEATHG